jgi:hypothetical protein
MMTGEAAALDHVVFLVRDVEAAAARLRERFGLGSVVGGRHDTGTASWVIPLANSQYLELLYVWDSELVVAQPDGQELLRRLDGGDFIVSWAVRTANIDAIAARFGIVPVAGRAVRPDASVSSWRIVSSPAWPDTYPFFIHYDRAEDRAAMWAGLYAQAGHQGDVRGITGVVVGGPHDPGEVLGDMGSRIGCRWHPDIGGIASVAVECGDETLEISLSA